MSLALKEHRRRDRLPFTPDVAGSSPLVPVRGPQIAGDQPPGYETT